MRVPLKSSRVEPVGFVVGFLAVALEERLELADVAVAPAGEALAVLVDVGLVAVRRGDLAEGGGEAQLGLVEQSEVVGEVHRSGSVIEMACAAFTADGRSARSAQPARDRRRLAQATTMPSASATLASRDGGDLEVRLLRDGVPARAA